MPREKSIAERFEAYVEAVGARLHKPNLRFLRDALFGLLENRSTLLSEIGRALNEPRRLIHTEKRLSRGLASRRYNDDAVEAEYLKLVAPTLRDERFPRPTIAVDVTDITKPKARKMPYLAGVRDGSTGQLGLGYNLICLEAVGARGRRLPLMTRLFSSTSPEYTSNNASIMAAIRATIPYVPKDAFWAFDSGFDGRTFFERFNELGLRYAIRLTLQGKRKLFTPVGAMTPSALVEKCPPTHRHRTRKQGRSSSTELKIGWVSDVYTQYYRPDGNTVLNKSETTRYSVVFASGHGLLGKEPLAILTNEDVRTAEDAGRIVDIYLERWGVEEANRFAKQGFDLENLRALTWTGVKRMAQLVYLAYGFLAQLVHGPREQTERIAATFKAFGPVPTYLYYRLLEGIGRLLRRTMDGGP
ncbi:transposase [Pyxidicoccus sp. MSG2]|uniref:transposase n=1 Tax=Pyxidicoccus sp. MSG2 TaxID=2996790 RepID=UPI0022705A21|nr:transposase [Pyxidicoccus sp. MSG2]MCY1018262.1 transposase [Pyxidicoccus sp. MSG2]